MPHHQRDEEPIERRLGLYQQCGGLARVEMTSPRQHCELVDERLAKAKKSLDGVGQGSAESRGYRAVFGGVLLSSGEQRRRFVAICIQTSQDVAHQLHSEATKVLALGFGDRAQPTAMPRRLRDRSRLPVGALHAAARGPKGWAPHPGNRHQGLDRRDQEAAVAAWSSER